MGQAGREGGREKGFLDAFLQTRMASSLLLSKPCLPLMNLWSDGKKEEERKKEKKLRGTIHGGEER